MSDEQPKQQTGNRWGDPIPPERAAKLRNLADRQRVWVDSAPDGQRDLDHSVFKGVRLTGADVFWLAAYALAGPDGNFDAAEEQMRATPDDITAPMLRFSQSSLHLEGAYLTEAHLETLYVNPLLPPW